MRIRTSDWSQRDKKTLKKWKVGVFVFYLCVGGLVAVSIVISNLSTGVAQYAAM
jgi:hypothetical protein